ncbi:lipopolysaccharide kinase InaA family protein [Streptomyces sp. NPDC006645]|uniref:protein kinase domain-containing protein n=1 Tax=unclassified Streptomyces TaxID=2593676 RepID=UPI0033A4CCDB
MTIPEQILTDAFGPDALDARVSLVADRRGTALWRVRHENGDQHALKITTACSDPQGHVDSERLALVEAQLLQALERDGVITGFYHQHGHLPDGEGSWLALRWLHGEEADTAFAKLRHTPSDRTAASYAAAMAGAVADLHDNGWRHGDMQEVHFLLHDDGAHLLDFAMAQPPAPAGPAPVTYRGAYDFFNSPELAARRLATKPSEHLELTTASEVWSLCATIYACWTGIYPISEKNTQLSTPALRAELAQGRCRDLTITRPWAFPAFEKAILAGLTMDPAQRPTARQLHHRFQELS